MFWKLTTATHLTAVAVAVAHPSAWPWALGAIAANHAVITSAGLWPRSSLLGSNWSRLPRDARARFQVNISIDDGPDPETTPRVLDILERGGARATFFCIGARVLQQRELVREMVARGHEIENHSFSHPYHFSLLGPRRMENQVARGQDAIESVTGKRPRFFRAPAGLRNPFLEPILKKHELQLASWTRRGFDTVATDPQLVLRRLLRNLAGGDMLLLHDGNAARDTSGTPIIEVVLPVLLDRLRESGLSTVRLDAALTAERVDPLQ